MSIAAMNDRNHFDSRQTPSQEEQEWCTASVSLISSAEDKRYGIDQMEFCIQPLQSVNSCCNGKGLPTLVLAASVAGLGGVLFGYDIGIVSGAILQLRSHFQLNCFQQEMVVSSMLFGALMASFSGGFIVDYLGRRLAIIINSGVFITGAVILAVSSSFPVLVLGRLIVGFGVSLSAIAECIYISEIAPASKRGLLVSINEVGICTGLLLAYLVNFAFIHQTNGWRYMFGLSCLPAFIQGVGMYFLPYSPRWLVLNGQEEKAVKMISRLQWCQDPCEEVSRIKSGLRVEYKYKFLDLFGRVDNMRTRMFVACGLVFFQQFTGQPNVLFYASPLFEALGFHSSSAATLATVGIGFAKLVATILSLATVDKGGRRKFLLIGASSMAICVLSLGLVATYNPLDKPTRKCREIVDVLPTTSLLSVQESTGIIQGFNLTATPALKVLPPKVIEANQTFSHLCNFSSCPSNVSSLPAKTVSTKTSPSVLQPTSITVVTQNSTNNITLVKPSVSAGVRYFSLVGLILFVGSYSFSFGPVCWLLLSEIFPTRIKGRAFSIATVLNWGTSLIVSFSFLDLLNAVGTAATFFIYTVSCVLSLVFIYVYVPETKNRTLEQISAEFSLRENGCKWRPSCCNKKGSRLQGPNSAQSGSRSAMLLDSDVET